MTLRLERLVAGRYLWPGKGGRLIVLVAGIGCAGVTIGVASLILVVAFMNGAQARLVGRIATIDGHLSIMRAGAPIRDWRAVRQLAADTPGVVRAVPSLSKNGLAMLDGRVFAADLQGMAPQDIARSQALSASMLVIGAKPAGPDDAVIGEGLAERLGARVGETIAIGAPVVRADGEVAMPTTGVRVAAIVETGVEAFDTKRVIVPRSTIERVLDVGDIASRIDVTLATEADTVQVAAVLRRRLGAGPIVRSWRQMNASLFGALAMEKVAMAAIVSVVTIIALFNILSSLTLLVRFKAREIAMVRTMGVTRGAVARIFVAVGGAIGATGGVAGLTIGLALIALKDPAVGMVRAMMARPPIELDALLSLPLAISAGEIGSITVLVAIGVLASTLYPALRAAAIDPAAVLRHG